MTVEVRLPATLPPLFPGLPRRVEVDAATVAEVVGVLEDRWPGLRDRLCEPGPAPALRRHIHVYVNGERTGLDAPLEPGARLDVVASISGG
jgi:molybdopterin synthase sulfur carrier subunit